MDSQTNEMQGISLIRGGVYLQTASGIHQTGSLVTTGSQAKCCPAISGLKNIQRTEIRRDFIEGK